ncbi:MAG: transketolase C-terminal domain-containing protein [Candidatus Pacebacteria bacterium]|nr:transketolase C-terminal domain-containing protein [Candidatus Paceibacterota bacterium]
MPKQCLRIVAGKYLAELAGQNKQIVALEADLKESTQSVNFERNHPDRYIECGIAEQNMVGVAAGLALAGKIPVVHSFACFISMRACEQVRTTVCYPNLNVKFLVTHAGISTGTAGTTHHAIEDIAIMRAIPNMTVIAPGDAKEVCQALDAAMNIDGPVYIRLGAGEAEDIYTDKNKFKVGYATQILDGTDLTIITTGMMMAEGFKVSKMLAHEGIKAGLLQMASIKPIDETAIIKAVKKTKLIITVEEHSALGGLGGAVCEIAAGLGAKVIRIGINDHFCDIGSAACLLEKEGLTAENIFKIIKRNYRA